MPLETAQFKSDETLVAEHDKLKKVSETKLYGKKDSGLFTELPLDLQVGKEPDQKYFQTFEHPDIKRNNSEETPGFFASIAHGFTETNELVSAYEGISSIPEHMNAYADPVPDGWTGATIEALDDVDQKYWQYVRDAVSPKDQESRRQWAINRQKETEKFNNGSLIGNLIGGIGGFTTSPSTYLFPFSATAKYATAGENVIRNISSIAPQLAIQSVAHNAILEGTRTGGNLEDAVVNSMRDTVAGLVLTGGAIGFGSAVTGGKLFAARKALNLNREGFDVHFEVGEKGEVIGLKARPLHGNSVSAAEVDEAQYFLDSTIAKEGLFKLIPGIGKAIGIFSPVVRMLNHSYKTVAEVGNRVFDHSIITKGLAEGRAQGDNFERGLWSVMNNSKQISWQIEGLRQEANGINALASSDKAKATLEQASNKMQSYSKEEFGSSVSAVIRTGEQHENKSINEASALILKHLEKTFKRFLKAHGLNDEVFTPRTAINYLMRNYNTDAMHPKLWEDTIAGHLELQDTLIGKIQKPLRDAEARLNSLKELKLTSGTDDKRILNEIKEATAVLKGEREKYINEVINNPDNHILLEERNFLNSKQRNELKSLLQPLKELQNNVNEQKALVDTASKELNRLKNLALKARKGETKERHLESMRQAKELLAKEQAELDKIQLTYLEADAELNGRALSGEVNPNFYFKDKNSQVHFKDPDALPKMRQVYEDDNARRLAAQSYRETILNTSPEQLNQQMLSSLSGGNLENPLKTRSIMIPDHVLQDAGFLDNDLSRNITTYDLVLGKKTLMKELFSTFGNGEGFEAVANSLNKEWRDREADILKMPKHKQEKAFKKNNKELSNALKLTKKAYDHAMGVNNSTKGQRTFSRNVRNFSVSTRLGAVPLTMITDIGGVFFANSFVDVIQSGIAPMIRTINGKIGSAEAKAYSENASHLMIATEHLGNAYINKAWSSGTIADLDVGGKITEGLEYVAQKSGNLSGANYIENFTQRLAANVTQSKVMRMMFKYKEGTLSKKETTQLLQFGIDPKEWADKFIANYHSAGGEGNGTGGHLSKYYHWEDAATKMKMANAIQSGVRQAVIKKGLGDAPFWTSDPMWGLFGHLKGWLFAATNRFAVPLMQRPDSEKMLGIGVMLFMGAWVDPLRKWTRGEEYDFSDKSKFALDAINNSGIGGIFTDAIQEMNAITGGELLPKMKTDRYRERSVAGIAAGPLGGIADDLASIFTSFASGKINTQDVNKAVRLIPLTQLWYSRYLSNKLVEQFDLPQNRNQAQGWFDR